MDEPDKKRSILSRAIDPNSVRDDPSSPGLTIPRSYGVYDTASRFRSSCGSRFRFGNYPIRMRELAHEQGQATLIALFQDREDAKSLADLLNE
jgi:hypothetical protein